MAILTSPAPGRNAPLYSRKSTLAGPARKGTTVQYKRVLSRRDNLVLGAIIALNMVAGGSLLTWLLIPAHLPSPRGMTVASVSSVVVVVVMVALELTRLTQSATLAHFASRARDPIPLVPNANPRVAMLTTIVPGKEPFALVLETLEAMLAVRYPGVMDVWLLDEGDDPEIKAVCEQRGIHHFSRRRRPEYNQPRGAFRAKTKHGNHNAWRAENEDEYDIVAQMDPDHVPTGDFLERTLGYFNDRDVAFVVAPQVYGNLVESWIAHGAAFLAYVFHGVIQRGGNGMAAPLLIGTNHLYRVTAFSQIGGYQDSIIEDHLTAMKIYATRNPLTKNFWKGVYTPDILAVGAGPSSFTDFFNQQKRWAYGIWEIIFSHSPRLFGAMKRSQRLSFAMLQTFYPSVAAEWILSYLLAATYLFGAKSPNLILWQWGALWGSSVGSTLVLFLWLRRFNLVEHERKDSGLIGMALMLMCIPVYTAAAIRRCTGRKLAYAVTAKGELTSPDNIRTFTPHLLWAALILVTLLATGASSATTPTMWLLWSLAISLMPVAVFSTIRLKAGKLALPGIRIRPASPRLSQRSSAEPILTGDASEGRLPAEARST